MLSAAASRWGLSGNYRSPIGVVRTGGAYDRFGSSSRGEELKYLDLVQAVVGVNTTGYLASLNPVAQGTGAQNRIGRKITIKSLQMKMGLLLGGSTSTGSTSEVFRVLLVWDKQCNGVLATRDDILGPSATYQSFQYLENGDRFKILRDNKYTLVKAAGVSVQAAYTELPGTAAVPNGGGFTSPATTSFWSEARRDINYYVKLNMPIEFSSTTGAITEVRSNNLLVLVIPEHGVGSDSILSYTSRIRYED